MKPAEVPIAVQQALQEFLAAARKYSLVWKRSGLPNPQGRKPLLQTQPSITKEVCELLADSVSIRTTCQVVGIGETTFHLWCDRGGDGEQPYVEF